MRAVRAAALLDRAVDLDVRDRERLGVQSLHLSDEGEEEGGRQGWADEGEKRDRGRELATAKP